MDSQMRSVAAHSQVEQNPHVLSSISTSGMSRTWSELAVSASKLNIAKYSEAKESSQLPLRAPAQQRNPSEPFALSFCKIE
jgi:hypothetical protein